MTHIFSSLFRCISTLLHANYHYSQHQSLSDHGYSLLPWIAPVRDQNDDHKPQSLNSNQSLEREECV